MSTYRGKCNSGFHHESSIEDDVLHYLGCLKFAERPKFLAGLKETDKLRQRIEEEDTRIAKLRKVFEVEGSETPRGKLLQRFKITRSHLFPATNRTRPAQVPPITESPVMEADHREVVAKDVELDDHNANMIFFKDAHPYDHPGFTDEKFPNQKIPVSQLLKDDKSNNPLMWECEENMIRYFHLPANNMAWIEEAIARYYNEPKPDLDGPYRKPPRGQQELKSRMVLRPQFWRGLQHGVRSSLPIHTRHMRPRCHPISTGEFYSQTSQEFIAMLIFGLDPVSTELKPKNLVLFMPYLHWETDRRRARAAESVKSKSNAKWATLLDVVEAKRLKVLESSIDRATSDGWYESITTRIENSQPGSATHIITTKTIQGQTLLGRLLLNAAALSEAMDAYSDELLIQKYLMAKPPLHPRRTLDQSYYWTLKDTRNRDRDQVVYRGTSPDPKLMHHKCFIQHCAQCKEDVTKVPRVVMVDQLWMWILDANTIITCFPKRWGRNKPDPSAVQKCIRTRLRSARDDEVKSVFDLAIIIMDQCSRVFFDGTQSTDLQPQVMDTFANAIGIVTHKQTIAFDRFWDYTKRTSLKHDPLDAPETSTRRRMQKGLLDINPEGDLLCEIKDIMEELFIMTLVKIQEEKVARTFVKHMRYFLQPSTTRVGDMTSRTPSHTSLPDLPNSPSLSRTKRPSLAAESHHKPSLPVLTTDLPGSDDFNWTMGRATDLLESIHSQLSELQHLRDSAENTSLALKDLLALKQQQAGILEARESVKQGEETLRQGRAIMLFTIVTIIFLPLSFFTGIFGMNATELTGSAGAFRFRNIFMFMIPISAFVITISLFLAFSKLVRAVISFAFNVSWAWLITRTFTYVRWHKTHLNSKSLKEEEKRIVGDMKARALRDEVERNMEKALLHAAAVKKQEEQQAILRANRARQTPNGDIEMARVV